MKMYNFLSKTLLIIFLSLFALPVNADEIKVLEKNSEFNVYTGMFDFSDHGKKSNIIGIQHQNEELK